MIKKIVPIAALLAPLALSGCKTTPVKVDSSATTMTEESKDAVDRAVARVKPSLVRIQVIEPDYDEGRESKSISFGSGTIITDDGFIMTNHHVAGKAVQIICTLGNREEMNAKLIATDPATDIAIIKLMPGTPMKFPFVEFGDSDAVKVGDTVMAMGSPAALSQSVTLGIIANTAMIQPLSWGSSYKFELDGENVGELVRWIGHDAQIFPGNSGGPLINMDGKIIGVNEVGIGLGGAIPGNLAKKVAFQLIENQAVKRAYAGITIQRLMKRSQDREGAIIASVLKESPAEKAGVKPGDHLLQVNDQKIEGRFNEDLPGINGIIADLPPGQESTWVLQRGTQALTVKVTPIQREPTLIPTLEMRQWGMTARNLTLWTKIGMARQTKDGVLVTSTRAGGPLAQAKPEIKPDDVIVKVNDTPIKSVQDLEALTKKLTEGKEGFVPALVTFERESEQFVTVVQVGIDKLQSPGKEVRKAWLPIETQVLTPEIASELGLENQKGVRVTRLYGNKPADFPLKVGDVITKVDGEPVDASKPVDAEVFPTLIRQMRVGNDVEFEVLRGKDKQTFKAKLEASPQASRELKRYRDLDFEFIAREASFKDRQKPTLAGVDFSVVADSVTQGGWADLGGMLVGDAILEIDGAPIKTIDDVEAAMKKAREEKHSSVIFFIRRDTQNLFLEMEPNW
ncbi:PDZ domain-containing protein [Candidatus Sumerlaeota bacterium]|nr:PDZ domain-containing protein [Candidatus Sumerlaeota bacterium]